MANHRNHYVHDVNYVKCLMVIGCNASVMDFFVDFRTYINL